MVEVGTGVHYGEDVVFHRPLKSGDDVSMKCTVVKADQRKKGSTLQTKYELFCEGELVLTHWTTTHYRGVSLGGMPPPMSLCIYTCMHTLHPPFTFLHRSTVVCHAPFSSSDLQVRPCIKVLLCFRPHFLGIESGGSPQHQFSQSRFRLLTTKRTCTQVRHDEGWGDIPKTAHVRMIKSTGQRLTPPPSHTRRVHTNLEPNSYRH
jgi:hypothetical protein